MIIDRIENIALYTGLGKNFATAAAWLKTLDPATLGPGQIGVDGERVFATLADNTLERKEPFYEAHRLYADIQWIMDGHEKFYLGTEGTVQDPVPDSDFCPCEVTAGMPFVLEKDWFVIFLPGEIHSPGNSAGEPSVCRKMVIKVRSDELK